jgi:hypothetical protein
MSIVTETIEVDVPVSIACHQWAQFGVAGQVTFDPLGPSSTGVSLTRQFEPAGVVGGLADRIGSVRSQARADLERFRDFINLRTATTAGARHELRGSFIR